MSLRILSGKVSHQEGSFSLKVLNRFKESFNMEISDIFSSKEIWNIRYVYNLAELMHHDQKRRTWKNRKYIEHIEDVTLRVIQNSQWIDVSCEQWKKTLKNRIIIALLHDIIEDTDVSTDILSQLFWEDVAVSVVHLTKKPWIHYIEKLPWITLTEEQKWILHKTWISSETKKVLIDFKDFDNKRSKIETLLPFFKNKGIEIIFLFSSNEEKQSFSFHSFFLKLNSGMGIPYSLLLKDERDVQMQEMLENFKGYKNQCRELRNREYHWNLALLSNDELFVKLCDRESNLSDLDGMWLEHEIKILVETVMYYLTPYASIKFPKLFKNIKALVDKNSTRLGNIWDLIQRILELKEIREKSLLLTYNG